MVAPTEQVLRVAPDWLESDTEESIVGTEWHQEAIGAFAYLLRVVAERRGSEWGVCEQVELGGLYRADGTAYNPRPDVMVLRAAIDPQRAGVALAEAGAPLLILEAASRSTVRKDAVGKVAVYAAAGVAEYLLFDPMGAVRQVPLQGWRLEAGAQVFTPWRPERDGRWWSQALEIWLWVEGPFLRVTDRDGTEIPLALEATRRLWAAEDQLAQERARREELEERLRRLEEASG